MNKRHDGLVLFLIVVFSVFRACRVCAGLVFSDDASIWSVRRFSHLHEMHVRWETFMISFEDLTCKYEEMMIMWCF